MHPMYSFRVGGAEHTGFQDFHTLDANAYCTLGNWRNVVVCVPVYTVVFTCVVYA